MYLFLTGATEKSSVKKSHKGLRIKKCNINHTHKENTKKRVHLGFPQNFAIIDKN